MADLSIHDIRSFEGLMENAEKCVIVTHMKPDGDAMGSSVAMYHFLKLIGKSDVNIVISDRYPDYLQFMISDKVSDNILICREQQDKAESAIAGADLIICLDFNAFHRTDTLEHYLSSAKADKVLIDHHLNPDKEKFNVVFSETEVSSASELLYHILIKTTQMNGKPSNLPKEAAVSLMTGMTTDTNNFANSTFPSTLRMTADLLEAGVDRDMIISELYSKYRENRVRLTGLALKDLLNITEDGVAYIVLDSNTLNKYNIQEGDTEGLVNIPLSIAKVRMSLLLKEDGERVRVSIRSKKGTSANRCAGLYFNGGGHENAAGGRLFIGTEIKDISQAADYIERHTHIFMTEENEK